MTLSKLTRRQCLIGAGVATGLGVLPGWLGYRLWQTLFDHLDYRHFLPGPQFSPAQLPIAWQFGAKRLLKGADITAQTIHRHQQGPARSENSYGHEVTGILNLVRFWPIQRKRNNYLLEV
jgi:hypothetical protein